MKFLAIAGVTLTAAATAPAATLVASGFQQPVFLASATGDSRLFVVEKTGRVKILGGDGSAWLDLSTQVNTAGERGLLGLAFDPQFQTNGRFYVDYIDKTTLNTVVASYTLGTDGQPDAASAKTILTVTQTGGFSNHKGGWIGFSSADPGNLYIATGDGGSANDPNNNAQNLNSNLGKLLRVTPNANGGYTVPTDNPFAGATAGNDEIWAYGLRNPYRSSFDRQTGDLWIADVGQGAREEVDFASAASGLGRGANYGWRLREGSIATPGSVGGAKPTGAVDPIYDYGRSQGGSIIGGYVYRGGADASLEGKYVFGDYVSGSIWALSGGTVTALDSPFGANQLTSFGESSDGALYALGIGGQVYLLAAAVPEPAPAALLALGLAAYALFTRRRRA